MTFNFVGVDDGHHSIKVTHAKGSFTYSSRARQGRHVINSMGGETGLYTTGEQGGDGEVSYTVNAFITEPVSTRFDEFPISPLNRVLVHHALAKSGLGGKKCAIATGLPFSHYYDNGERNDVLIEAKRKSLAKPVTSENRKLAEIAKNFVTTEGIAAYMDQLMTMDGDETPLCADLTGTTVGVIDIGGRTTDIAVMLPQEDNSGAQIDVARSGSDMRGMLMLNDRMGARLRQKFRFSNIDPSELEKAVRNGRFNWDCETQDVSDILLEEKQEVMSEILQIIKAKIGMGKELGRLVIVGGGSLILRDQLKEHFPKAIYPDEPQYANSRGMYKIVKYMSGLDGAE